MRSTALILVVGMAVAAPALGQQPSSANAADQPPAATSTQDKTPPLPVSLDKIKGALSKEPAEPLRGLNDQAHFKVEITERQKISIEDLIAAMDFRSGPAVAGGLYAYEQNRLAFPAVDNPLRQPYAAFSQAELLTIVIQNLALKYLGGRALNAVTNAQRFSAEQAARHEVQLAVAAYCAAQPNGGAGIQLCLISPER
jgi:hypothetical protein